MTLLVTQTEDVNTASTTATLSAFLSITNAGNPEYLVVDALDREEYTAAANGQTGDFSANGATLDFTATGGDAYGAGIVYTWNAKSDVYTNTTYGTLSQLTYTTSSSQNDVTSISLFGTSNQALAMQEANNAYGLMTSDASGFIGSITFITDPNCPGSPPAAATPDGVAAAALSFVGDAWNDNGCWLLASTIAAEAGAGLPVQSTAVGVAGKPNGEWITVYNGPASANSNWETLVTAGDIIGFVPAGGGGHITTCVSGSGASAMLVDNITLVNSHGKITNLANDGSPNDIVVQAPHPASQEFSGVAPSSVVVYALDTPAITHLATATTTVSAGTAVAFSKLFSAADPANRGITKFQVYESNNADTLTLNGAAQTTGMSAAGVLTATSLASLGLATAGSGTDTLEIRAFNGVYWGDWQSETITVTAVVPVPPVLAAHTANQTWKQGTHVSLALAAGTFTDPQHEALTYSASGLPSWLSFNPATRDFSGTVPSGPENFQLVVTATDTGGLSNTETFTVTVPAAAPVLAEKATPQTWQEGQSVNYALPTNNFTDPQGEALTYTATLSSGAALPSWLSFSASSLSFSGTAPATAQTLQLKITATDTSNLSATETISAAIVKAAAAFSLADWVGDIAPPLTPFVSTVPSHLPVSPEVVMQILPGWHMHQ
jgi:hypothetical protein